MNMRKILYILAIIILTIVAFLYWSLIIADNIVNRDITAHYLFPQEYSLALLTFLMVVLLSSRAIGAWKNQIDIIRNPEGWRAKIAMHTGTVLIVLGLLFLPFGAFQNIIGNIIGIRYGYFDGNFIVLSAKVLAIGIVFYELGRLFHIEKINTQQIV